MRVLDALSGSSVSLFRRPSWLQRVVGLVILTATLAASVGATGTPGLLGRHCPQHHGHATDHAGVANSHAPSAQPAIGAVHAGSSHGCPHCPATQCAGALMCAPGIGAVMPARSPVLAEVAPHVVKAPSAPAWAWSSVLQPPTPPPQPIA